MKSVSKADQKAGVGFLDSAGTIYSAVLNQGTEKYYTNDGTDTGKLVYATNPQVKKAWNTTISAINAGIGTRISQFTADWNVGMTKGTFATILAPAWMMDYIKSQAPDTAGKWDIASMPGGGGNQGGTQLTIPASAKNKQAAWDFISWYLAPAQQLKVFKTYGLFPSTPSLYSDPALTGYSDPFFNNAPVGKIYSAGILKLKPIFEGKLNRAIDQAFGAGLGRVASKKQTATQSWTQVLSDLKKVTG
jgi:cellobiose transport system substrate-binding protein